jgi:hypothetical protein
MSHTSAELSGCRNVSHRCRSVPVPKCLAFILVQSSLEDYRSNVEQLNHQRFESAKICEPLDIELEVKKRHWLRLPGLGNNEKLGLPERLSAGIQFRFRNLFHGKISGNRNFICLVMFKLVLKFLKWLKLLSNFKIEGLDSLIRVHFKIPKWTTCLDNIHGQLFSAPLAMFLHKQI